MYKTYSFFYTQILFTVYVTHIDLCKVFAGDLKDQESKLNTLIEELHSMYKDAFENGKTYITRRFFTKDEHSHYTLHVQKLKEVNGVKTHNLRLENKSERNGPIIYINNPVEAGMPNPFLNIDQFKTAMYERVQRQKKEFFANSNPLIKTEKFKVFKHLEVVPTKLFDVKKHVKQLADPSNNMKTRGIYKANKKRTQKVYVSHATKSKTKARIRATAALPKETISNTFEIIEEQRTTHDTVEVNTSDREICTETIVVKKITTETPVAEEIINKTESDDKNTIPTTVDDEKSTETLVENGITTETLIDEVKNDTTAVEENNTETIINKEVITERTTQEEIITEPVTTTESTVRTKRNRQLRPYVFLGQR